MSAGRHVLAIDAGTQSLRAVLFDAAGTVVAEGIAALDPPRAPRPGWAEQDADYFWKALCRACQALWQAEPSARRRVAGVALTTQRATVINLDAGGRPLRPAIVWPDQRRAVGVPPVGGLDGILLRLAGMHTTVRHFQAEAEANWLAANEPDVWARTRHFLLLSGYLSYRLTGVLADAAAAQVAYLPFDFRRSRFAPPGHWRWRAVPGLRPEMLPRLVAPGEVLGTIAGDASQASGIPAGVPLVATAADKACEALGAGCRTADTACLSLGTAATVNVTTARYVEPRRFLPPYPAALPGRYACEIQISRGFWLVSWFLREFGADEMREAAALGVAPETLLDRLLERSPPGAGGLLAQPYWLPGVKHPGPEARGALVGFAPRHGRADVYRALLEGVACALREGAQQIARRTGIGIRQLRVAGGGARSDAVMQLVADVFGLPATRPQTPHAAALGAAVVAAVALGLHPDHEAALASMCRSGDSFEPDAASHAVYDEQFRRVYRRLYRRLRPLYRRAHQACGS